MLTELQLQKISEQYNFYNNSIKPLIAIIEANYETFPLPIFNEIRAQNDHIAQCYRIDIASIDIDKEIESANGHLQRIILDCFKYLNIFYYEKIKRFNRQTRNIDLTAINNGIFYIEYRKISQEVVKLVKNAKSIESKDKNKATELFEKSFNKYCELDNLIDNNLTNVNWAKAKFQIKRFVKIILWLIAAIISGFISIFFTCDKIEVFIKHFLNFQ